MKFKYYILLTITYFLFTACKAELEVVEDFSSLNYSLLNQDSVVVEFPKSLKGKIGVVSYIYTYCYDICPMTTENMRLIQEKVLNEKIPNVELLSISFDHKVDKPSVLKRYAKVRGLELTNWQLLTGEKEVIEPFMEKVGITAFVADSTAFTNGSKVYFYVHTDRIQLFDQKGVLRKNYLGSEIKIDEIMDDIKTLDEEGKNSRVFTK